MVLFFAVCLWRFTPFEWSPFNFKSVKAQRAAIKHLSEQLRLMKSSSHSLVRERPIAQSEDRHIRPMCLSGRSSCDTPPKEFGVVDLVAQHDKATHQQFSGHRHFGFRPTATMNQPMIEPFQIRILATSRLTRFVEQKPQQARAFFADAAEAAAFCRRVFHRIKTNVSNYGSSTVKA